MIVQTRRVFVLKVKTFWSAAAVTTASASAAAGSAAASAATASAAAEAATALEKSTGKSDRS